MIMQERRAFTPLESCGEHNPGNLSKLLLTGFTLIELLIVMAIISILMSILLPSLSKSRDQAKSAVCRSNMRQIGFAANFYAEDHDSRVPRGTGGPIWFQVFMPYLAQRPVNDDYRNVKIYRCPSYPNKEQTVCYVANGWEFSSDSDTFGDETGEATRLSQCRRRAYTIYLADNEYGPWRKIIKTATDDGIRRCDVWHPGHLPSSDTDDESHGRRVARNRHKGGSNCLYLDWHVGWLATEDNTVDMWRVHTFR